MRKLVKTTTDIFIIPMVKRMLAASSCDLEGTVFLCVEGFLRTEVSHLLCMPDDFPIMSLLLFFCLNYIIGRLESCGFLLFQGLRL